LYLKDDINGLGKQVPPLLKHVVIYFLELGKKQSEAEAFYKFYEQRKWQYRGRLIRNWKELAWHWVYNKSIDPSCLS